MIAAILRAILAPSSRQDDWTAGYVHTRRQGRAAATSRHQERREERRQRTAAHNARSWCRAGWEI